jgi:Leucine-rich repeat (LRR) protein
MTELTEEEPRTAPSAKQSKSENETDGKPKYETNAIRLNNNSLSNIKDFPEVVAKLVSQPSQLSWIDLSFNNIPTIDEVLLEYPNVTVLYLHANSIDKLSEVDKLAQLEKLKTLTLHGNPIESVKGYREYVVSTLPQLKNFDFSGVTKSDRARAASWQSMCGSKMRGKRK